MVETVRRRDAFDVLDDLEREHGIDLRRGRTPERAANTRRLLVERMSKDPLLRQYIVASAGSSHGARVTEPWMALAEQRMMTLIIADDGAGIEIPMEDDKDDTSEVKRTVLASQLAIAQTFLWSKEVFDALKACPMPPHVVGRDILPFPFTYHSLEVAYELTATDASRHILQGSQTDWIAISDVPAQNGCTISQNICSPDRTVRIVQSGLRYNRMYPDDFPDYSRAPLATILSMLAFLKSPYTSVEERKLPRQWRHGESALAKNDADKVIHVVELRRSAKDAVAAYAAESRAFKHRWWVAGHFRSQWYASKQSHEVIWIAPHIKGPDGAPMLDKIYAVRR